MEQRLGMGLGMLRDPRDYRDQGWGVGVGKDLGEKRLFLLSLRADPSELDPAGRGFFGNLQPLSRTGTVLLLRIWFPWNS